MPWRAADLDGPHPDPYGVLVSELMLQQTQVSTVIPYFHRWMEAFPDPGALARADEQSTHKLWEGLGYYRRCRFLKAAATRIHQEGWPQDLLGLQALPGLGPYTAAAVGAIAFQWPTPALDGNAFRVLARLLLVEGDPKKAAGALRDWLVPGLKAHGPSRLTQALMELGATLCTPTPRCGDCPLQDTCAAHRTGRVAEIPPVNARSPVKESSLWLLAIEAGGSYLLHPPASRGLLAGLWRWPTHDMETPREIAAETPTAFASLVVETFEGWTQVYTHRRERVTPLHLWLDRPFPVTEGLVWVPGHELHQLPLGRRDARLRDLLARPGHPSIGMPRDLGPLLDQLRRA